VRSRHIHFSSSSASDKTIRLLEEFGQDHVKTVTIENFAGSDDFLLQITPIFRNARIFANMSADATSTSHTYPVQGSKRLHSLDLSNALPVSYSPRTDIMLRAIGDLILSSPNLKILRGACDKPIPFGWDLAVELQSNIPKLEELYDYPLSISQLISSGALQNLRILHIRSLAELTDGMSDRNQPSAGYLLPHLVEMTLLHGHLNPLSSMPPRAIGPIRKLVLDGMIGVRATSESIVKLVRLHGSTLKELSIVNRPEFHFNGGRDYIGDCMEALLAGCRHLESLTVDLFCRETPFAHWVSTGLQSVVQRYRQLG
jgi:hypothetical protein